MADNIAQNYGIEELSSITGMTVRNIRAYQTKGLLHSPVRSGRSVIYDETHVVRLRLVGALREQGYGLPVIARRLRTPNQWADSETQGGTGVHIDRSTWVLLGDDFLNGWRTQTPLSFEAMVDFGVLYRAEGGYLCHPTLTHLGLVLADSGVDAVEMFDLQARALSRIADTAHDLARIVESLDHQSAALSLPLLERMLVIGHQLGLHQVMHRVLADAFMPPD